MSNTPDLGVQADTSVQQVSSNDTPSNVSASVSEVNTESNSPQSESTHTEKLYTREQLARASKEAAKNVYDKAYQDALKQLQAQQQQQTNNSPPPQSQGPIDENKAREIVRQENLRMQEQQKSDDYYNNLTRDFMGKVEAAKVVNPDIVDKFRELGMDFNKVTPADPRVQLFNSVDNLADIVDEMDKNPAKLTEVLGLLSLDVNTGSRLSYREIKKLSDSIKANKAAKELPKSPKPATQIEPSNAGLSSGEISISAERRKSMYRF